MNSRNAEASPQIYARVGGILYFLLILAGLLGVIFVRGKLVVSGDPAATAANIMASPSLWRIGIAGDLVMHVFDIPIMWVIYILLRPVNKNLALLSLLFNLIQTAVLVANKLNLLSALFLLGSEEYLKAFEPSQLHTQAYLAIKLHEYGFGVGLIFFGLVCLVNGYLIIRSGYLPKLIGAGLQIAGVCYLVNSFALIMAPGLSGVLFPWVMIPIFFAELSFCLWLIFKGVNLEKWHERMSAL